MQKSTVVEILKHFSEDDIAQFSDFVISPFFNKNKSVSKLFAELKKHYADFDSENLKKENIWKKIYPGKAFNYGVLKNLIHELAKLLEEYMAIYKFQDDKIQTDHYMLSGIYDRSMFNFFPKKYSVIEKKHADFIKANNSCHFYHIFSEITHLNFVHKLNHEMDTDAPDEGYKFMVYRVVYFLCVIFRDYADHIVSKMVTKSAHIKDDFSSIFFANFNNENIDKVIDQLKDDFPKEHKTLLVYRNMYLSYVNFSSFEHYETFKKSVFKVANLLPKLELRALCYKLRNIIAIMNQNKVDGRVLQKEALEIWDFLIEQGIFTHLDGTLSEFEFNNYITNVVNLKNDAKLEKFIGVFADKVAEPYKKNAYNYAMANLLYLRKEYDKTLTYVAKLVNDYTLLKLSIRMLQVKCYYELNDYESFILLYNSLKKFDHKNIFGMENSKDILLNICNIVNKLFKIKNSYDSIELKFLKNELNDKGLKERIWLNEKIIEIEIANKKYKKHA